jgi:cytidine deaminase
MASLPITAISWLVSDCLNVSIMSIAGSYGYLDLLTRFVNLIHYAPINVEIRINIEEYTTPDELSAVEQQLIERAIASARDAYAPYSELRVGACLILDNGSFVQGNNQENAAHPDGLCAERVALFAAHAKYPGSAVKMMAIAAFYQENIVDQPVYPCGSCRQALLESENRFDQPVRILMYGKKGIQVVNSIRDLLPLSFDLSFLTSG